jgi:hypothetical protein
MFYFVIIFLTLLWYHEKSYVNSTMGSIWPHCKKKTRIKHDLLKCFFSPNNISQHRFVLKYRQTDRHDFVLGNFEYIQKQIQKYTENVLQSVSNTQEAKKLLTHCCYANWLASIIFRPNVCSTFFGALFVDNYLYYMEGNMGSICLQAEININKK